MASGITRRLTFVPMAALHTVASSTFCGTAALTTTTLFTSTTTTTTIRAPSSVLVVTSSSDAGVRYASQVAAKVASPKKRAATTKDKTVAATMAATTTKETPVATTTTAAAAAATPAVRATNRSTRGGGRGAASSTVSSRVAAAAAKAAVTTPTTAKTSTTVVTPTPTTATSASGALAAAAARPHLVPVAAGSRGVPVRGRYSPNYRGRGTSAAPNPNYVPSNRGGGHGGSASSRDNRDPAWWKTPAGERERERLRRSATERRDQGHAKPQSYRISGDKEMAKEEREELHIETELWRRNDFDVRRNTRHFDADNKVVSPIVTIPAITPTQQVEAVAGMPAAVPFMASNLRSAVLKDGVSLADEHDPYFKTIVQPHNINFDVIPSFITSSRDPTLRQLAADNNCQVVASTSSSSSLLAQIHFALHGMAPRDMTGFSPEFGMTAKNFTQTLTKAGSVVLHKREGDIWGIDSGPQAEPRHNQILIDLGKTMERMLTMEPADFQKTLDRSSPKFEEHISNEEKDALANREPYTFLKIGGLLLRSQLDASDTKLEEGRQVFDLKTRATLPIRLDCINYRDYIPYRIVKEEGLFHSFERERFDMCRSAYLKYALQCRIGHMGGIMVAYHNTQEIFGFEYISLERMEKVLFGGGKDNRRLADMSFNLSLTIYDLMMKLVLTDLEANHYALRLTVAPGERSNHFRMGDTHSPTSMRLWIELLPDEKDDPESHLPWVERRSSALRVDRLSKSDVITHLTTLGKSTEGTIFDMRARLEGALTKDNAIAAHEYYEKLMSLGLIRGYDLELTVRHFPFNLFKGSTGTAPSATDDASAPAQSQQPQIDYLWKKLDFPARVGAELYRRHISPPYDDEDRPPRPTVASTIPMVPGQFVAHSQANQFMKGRPTKGAPTSAATPTADQVDAAVDEAEDSSSDEEVGRVHTPPSTITAATSAATATAVTATTDGGAEKKPYKKKSAALGSILTDMKTSSSSSSTSTTSTSASSSSSSVASVASSMPSFTSVIAAVQRTSSSSTKSTTAPSSSSSSDKLPSKPRGRPKKVVATTDDALASETKEKKEAKKVAEKKEGFLNKLFSASAMASIVMPLSPAATMTRTKLVSAAAVSGMTPRRSLMTSCAWYEASSSSSSSSPSSSSPKRHVMPAPLAPLPFMATSDMERLMKNTSFLESMPSTLAEAEADSEWRSRNVPAADLALAGDAAAPLASTRHAHDSYATQQRYDRMNGSSTSSMNRNAAPYSDDEYDQDETNSMLQQAFYVPPPASSPAAATSAASATTEESGEKSKLRQFLEGELQSLLNGKSSKKNKKQ